MFRSGKLIASGLLGLSMIATTASSVPAAAADDHITVNPGGGQGAGDGLAIHYAGGQFQITRKGTGQLYDQELFPPTDRMFNHVSLSIGQPGEPITMFAPGVYVGTQYNYFYLSDTTELLPWSIETQQQDDGFTSILTGRHKGRSYTVTLNATYVPPNDYFQLDYTVDVPRGNDEPVRLFHLLDTYLEENDAGPGFYREPTCAGPMVGVDRSDVGSVEALQYLGGRKWSGYASMDYSSVVFGKKSEYVTNDGFGPSWARDLPNTIDDNPNTDNGIGTSWNLGREPGTYESSSRLIFTDKIPVDCPTETAFVNPPSTFTKGKPFPMTVKVTGFEGLSPTGTAQIRHGDDVLCTGPVNAQGLLTCNVTLTSDSADLDAFFTGTGDFTDSVSEPHSMVSTVAVMAITSISPPKGPISGGDLVTIKGENFAEGATVKIGGVSCRDPEVIDTETIICITGERKAGTVDVVVTNPDGKSAALTDGYTYLKDAPTPAQKYYNTLQSGSVKKKKGGKKSVLLRGTSKRKKTRVYIYRADKPRSAAKLVRVVRSKKHIWKSNNTPMGKRKSAYFCARFNTKRGPWADTIRVPKLTPKKASSSVAGEVRIMRCPRIKR